MYLPPFNTQRLHIRPATIDDAVLWEPFFTDNYFIKYLNFPQGFNVQEESKKWIERQLWRYENKLYGLMALVDKNTGHYIGQCGWLVQEVDGKQEVEIGYHLLPAYWGKGYALEAATAFKEKAKEQKISASIISIIHIENTRSQRVAEKNGMKREKQCNFKDSPCYIYRIEL